VYKPSYGYGSEKASYASKEDSWTSEYYYDACRVSDLYFVDGSDFIITCAQRPDYKTAH